MKREFESDVLSCDVGEMVGSVVRRLAGSVHTYVLQMYVCLAALGHPTDIVRLDCRDGSCQTHGGAFVLFGLVFVMGVTRGHTTGLAFFPFSAGRKCSCWAVR